MEEEYYEEYEGDYFEEEYHLTDEEVLQIQEEYRRKRLVESLIGPIVSTTFHIVLIIILAIFIVDQVKEPVAEIVVTMEEVEEVVVEPPPVEEPKPIETKEDITNPVLTTVKVENVETNDTALEDTNDEAPQTDDNMQTEAVSDVVVSPSAFASPSVYGGRSAAGRASAVSQFGGSKVGQDALMKALWWLAKVQNPDGSWGKKDHAAYTGLALLTFLAHGETPTSKHFGTNVKKAMQWLIEDPINVKLSHGYPHAIKTYAIAEAYAMTGVSYLGEKMDVCVDILIKGQLKEGSYNYSYDTEEGKKEDLSFAGWNYQALKAAYGAGCENPGLPEAIYKAIEWLKKHGGSNDYGDGFPYAIKDGKRKVLHDFTVRAVGCLCLQLFGEGQSPEINDELDAIATKDLEKLNWNNPPKKAALYGWYYATQAMFQEGGPRWKAWNRKFQKELTENQQAEGYWFYPGSRHGSADDLTDKIYATTLCALQLTVYYRYLPSSKGAIGDKGMKNAVEKKKEDQPVMKEEGLDLVD